MRMQQGDCLHLMDSIPSSSVDLILCDLPYGTTQNAWDCPIHLPSLWRQYWRVAKENCAIILTAQTPFDKVLGVSQLHYLRYEWIWEKTAGTGFLNAKIAPIKCHENVLVFYKKRPLYVPTMTKGATIKRVKENMASHGSNYGLTKPIRRPYESTERYPRSVLTLPKDNRMQAIHPTQKPVALMEYFIQTYTNPGDVVLDNCMGSGTTGVACMNTGRDFIGFELDPDYFKAAENRVYDAYANALLKGVSQ